MAVNRLMISLVDCWVLSSFKNISVKPYMVSSLRSSGPRLLNNLYLYRVSVFGSSAFFMFYFSFTGFFLLPLSCIHYEEIFHEVEHGVACNVLTVRCYQKLVLHLWCCVVQSDTFNSLRQSNTGRVPATLNFVSINMLVHNR